MTLKFLHVSDIHFGVEHENAVTAFTEYAEAISPDAIIVSGDLTQRGTVPEFKAACEWLKSLSSPWIATPGNHDTPLLDLKARMTKPFRRYEQYIGPESDFLYRADVSIGSLNTSRGWQIRGNWAEGSVHLTALSSTIQRMVSNNPTAFNIITCHHPMVPPHHVQLPVRTRRGPKASTIIAHSPIDMVLTGHVHAPTAEYIQHGERGYLAITAGTLSKRLRGVLPSFNEIDVTSEAVTVRCHDVDTHQLKARPLGQFDRLGT